jgi:hypothetical protein
VQYITDNILIENCPKEFPIPFTLLVAIESLVFPYKPMQTKISRHFFAVFVEHGQHYAINFQI